MTTDTLPATPEAPAEEPPAEHQPDGAADDVAGDGRQVLNIGAVWRVAAMADRHRDEIRTRLGEQRRELRDLSVEAETLPLAHQTAPDHLAARARDLRDRLIASLPEEFADEARSTIPELPNDPSVEQASIALAGIAGFGESLINSVASQMPSKVGISAPKTGKANTANSGGHAPNTTANTPSGGVGQYL